MVTATQPRSPTLEERIAAANVPGDLSIYSKAVHNLTLEPYQLAWEEALETMDRVVIVCPPDTFKSTTVQHWVERSIGRNPDIRILWLMNSGEQAAKRVMAVASTIESNTIYKRAFKVRPNKETGQWTQTVLYVHRSNPGLNAADPTLMGVGLNGPYQGLHFDVIVIDDPTNQEDVRSPTTMDLQVSKIRGVVVDRLVEGGRIVVILTRWGDNDLVPTFEQMGFTIIEMPVLSDKYPWGPTISPRRFTDAKIEELRRDKGDALFQLTFMCNPSALAGNIIKREHIRYWDNSTLPNKPLDIFMGIDPAASEKSLADPSAICTLGLEASTRNMYLLDMFCENLDVPRLELEIVRRARHTAGLRAIGVETIAFQLSLVQYLKRHRGLPLVELPYRTNRSYMNKAHALDRDKTSRTMYLDSLLISGRLFIPRNLPLYKGVSYEAELCSAPFGAHDDRMDATVFAAALADSMYNPRPHIALVPW
jgi:hypothetical protein